MKRQELAEVLPARPISLLLAEDYANFRKNLKILVEMEGDIVVVGEAKNGLEAVQLAESLKPDVVVMDIAMPLLNGIEATPQIVEISPTTRVIILSAHSDPEYLRQAVMVGASGYLIKQSSIKFLAQAVREVVEGHAYFNASIPQALNAECQTLFDKAQILRKKSCGSLQPDIPRDH